MSTYIMDSKFGLKKGPSFSWWQIIAICLSVCIILYQWMLLFSSNSSVYSKNDSRESVTDSELIYVANILSVDKVSKHNTSISIDAIHKSKPIIIPLEKNVERKDTPIINPIVKSTKPTQKIVFEYAKIPLVPVLGAPPDNGAKPLFGFTHYKFHDAVFALACNYPLLYFKRFVGSLRKFNYTGDIVLGVSPLPRLHTHLMQYLKDTNVLSYEFDVDCNGKDNCKLKDSFLGYPDPRPFRSFANIRYALYEYWIRYYNEQSYILILDFRDTFFQADPFQSFGYPVSNRVAKYDLQVYAENEKV